ncbi:hypothetical protein TNIN_250641 [Trichonephila inaurata madagascariensis]|uniref:Uncharacterized protein n=1 Tax=Trichonephila inaurata madagascariensis TaxID=2747483 RepID=A0A8X6JCH0_9ARAC|nr:hypothetical protein TNIN_250641 [Trichonephila inaurata madagascariensis]
MVMAIHFLLEIAFHLLQCAFYFAFELQMPSFYEIFLFELAFEAIKNCTVEKQIITRSEIEAPISFNPLSVTNFTDGTPVVRSIIVHRICQALDLKTMLAFSNGINSEIQSEPRKVKPFAPVPAVYSFTLFKMCEALNINVELHPKSKRPPFVNKKKRQIPVVYSTTVFYMCQALKLDAQLADILDK